MAVIFRVPAANSMGDQFRRFLQESSPATDYDICHTVNELSEALRTRYLEIMVVVLVIQGKRDFAKILSLRNFLENKYIMLVLPDDEPDLVAKAHLLRPRFVTQRNEDFQEMKLVLKRMLDLYDKPF